MEIDWNSLDKYGNFKGLGDPMFGSSLRELYFEDSQGNLYSMISFGGGGFRVNGHAHAMTRLVKEGDGFRVSYLGFVDGKKTYKEVRGIKINLVPESASKRFELALIPKKTILERILETIQVGSKSERREVVRV